MPIEVVSDTNAGSRVGGSDQIRLNTPSVAGSVTGFSGIASVRRNSCSSTTEVSSFEELSPHPTIKTIDKNTINKPNFFILAPMFYVYFFPSIITTNQRELKLL